MISFNLKCIDCEYEFEGWFENSNSYFKQKKNKLITCPSCDSYKIQKGLMAPNLSKKSNSNNMRKMYPLLNSVKSNLVKRSKTYKHFVSKLTQMAFKTKKEAAQLRIACCVKQNHAF